MSSKTAPALAWIHDLYEVGTLTKMADEEQEMLARRAALLAQVAELDTRVAALRKRTVREVAGCGYTEADVEQAKRFAARRVA